MANRDISPLEAALDYAARGYSVFPCWPCSKNPVTKHGFKDATSNPATIRRWFGRGQPYNVAIRTGVASGAWVDDVDDRHGGFESLAELERRHGPLPLTLQCKTADGIHHWWRATCPIQCSDDRVARGIGVKADGGYAMVPPSVHPDGPIYTWANDEPLAEAPEWLVALTRKVSSNSARALAARAQRSGVAEPRILDHYGAAALEREIAALAATPFGSRNHALNRASFSLHQLVAGGVLEAAVVERELLAAADANGLMSDPNDGPRKVMATIESGARAGLQNPRRPR